MVIDAALRLLEVFYAIVENTELVIQLAQEVKGSGLINQEIAELHKRFAAYRTALEQMTDQGGEMVPLPQGTKLEKPRFFIGITDTDTVKAFVFQVEQYFALTNMVDAH